MAGDNAVIWFVFLILVALLLIYLATVQSQPIQVEIVHRMPELLAFRTPPQLGPTSQWKPSATAAETEEKQ